MIARNKYDHEVLHELAVGGETLSMPALYIDDSEKNGASLGWAVVVLAFVSFVSILINLAQWLGR